MGNCLSEGRRSQRKTLEQPTLREMTYPDRQRGVQARNGLSRSVQRYPTALPAGSYSSHLMHPGYHGLESPLHYPIDPLGAYYQPRGGPLLLMDLYSGATYEYRQERFEEHLGSQPHQRRKEREKVQQQQDAHKEDEEDGKTHHHHHSKAGKHSIKDSGGPGHSATEHVTTSVSRYSHGYQPPDVVINYSDADSDIVQKIKEKLDLEGISTWVCNVVDMPSRIGKAIIDAKLLLCILSNQMVQTKSCRDQVALAYVSNTIIFPVNVQPEEELLAQMDTRLKLLLTTYKWTSLSDPNDLDNQTNVLVSTVKGELEDLHKLAEVSANSQDIPTGTGDAVLNDEKESAAKDRRESGFKSPRLKERNRAFTTFPDDVSSVLADQFWRDQFGDSQEVSWNSLANALLEKFQEPMARTFAETDQKQLMEVLKRELRVEDEERLVRQQFIGATVGLTMLMTEHLVAAFCSTHGAVLPVWRRVEEQAREHFATREVFSADSTVRVDAVENLSKFRSAAVIDVLRDLLTDPDANVRAVATVSLSRTDAKDPETRRRIMSMLDDRDRLVREAGCLALGHLKARDAVSTLTHIWRNDVNSHVRDAAAIALHQIGDQEVDDVMRLTKVLAEEIRTLTEMET